MKSFLCSKGLPILALLPLKKNIQKKTFRFEPLTQLLHYFGNQRPSFCVCTCMSDGSGMCSKLFSRLHTNHVAGKWVSMVFSTFNSIPTPKIWVLDYPSGQPKQNYFGKFRYFGSFVSFRFGSVRSRNTETELLSSFVAYFKFFVLILTIFKKKIPQFLWNRI